MMLECNYADDEMQTISFYCGDKANILGEISNDCYVFDLHGRYFYNECFEAAKNEYFHAQKLDSELKELEEL